MQGKPGAADIRQYNNLALLFSARIELLGRSKRCRCQAIEVPIAVRGAFYIIRLAM
jgi:hypothetical protein